jgi:hypothetical protein
MTSGAITTQTPKKRATIRYTIAFGIAAIACASLSALVYERLTGFQWLAIEFTGALAFAGFVASTLPVLFSRLNKVFAFLLSILLFLTGFVLYLLLSMPRVPAGTPADLGFDPPARSPEQTAGSFLAKLDLGQLDEALSMVSGTEHKFALRNYTHEQIEAEKGKYITEIYGKERAPLGRVLERRLLSVSEYRYKDHVWPHDSYVPAARTSVSYKAKLENPIGKESSCLYEAVRLAAYNSHEWKVTGYYASLWTGELCGIR